MKNPSRKLLLKRKKSAGFSLVEILVASFLGVIVAGLMVSSLIMNLRGQRITTTYNENLSEANTGLQRIIYGFDGTPGLREANTDLFNIQVIPGGVILDFGEDGRKIVYNQAVGTVIDNGGEVYARGVTNFQAQKLGRRVVLTLTVRDNTLQKPIEQTLKGEIVLRNKNLPPPDFSS